MMVCSNETLLCLAGQLGNPEDRHNYTKIILKKELLKTQLETLQVSLQQQKRYEEEEEEEDDDDEMSLLPLMTSSSSYYSPPSSFRQSMSSYSLLLSKSVSMYQPQLQQYDSNLWSSKQIDRLSSQYRSNVIQLVTSNAPSLTTVTNLKNPSLKVKTTNLHSSLPVSPPLSPPSSSICLSPSSNAFPIVKSSSSSSSSSSSLDQISSSNIHKSVSSTNLSVPASPPASPKRAYHIISKDEPHNQARTMIPIQKNHQMRLRTFLRQSVTLNKWIRVGTSQTKDPRFYQAKSLLSGQSKWVLKLLITKTTCSSDDPLAPFGIQFVNPALSTMSIQQDSYYSMIPDSLVLEALDIWLKKSHCPPVTDASHIMRDGTKLYIIFDPIRT
ncbi:uncharacterized protein BX664DRAFT_338822 [Halteromyces radiatus]|uniref:uncharacterized protein n=1 Tax=Halteromyces radiatus TaxID=101107 RepID=UPI00221FE30B|nr:uncharacterized protein BX664DRAFT_338822 [Halteromyces radiatus]KAI8085206.1 hypothetical protein BX664DRAFT_338822 [Halteromyces radiatus]